MTTGSGGLPPLTPKRWRHIDSRLSRDVLIVIYGVAAAIAIALFLEYVPHSTVRASRIGTPAPMPSRTAVKTADFGVPIVLHDSFGSRLWIKPTVARRVATPKWVNGVETRTMLGVRFEFDNRGGSTVRDSPCNSCWLLDGDGVEWPAEAVLIGHGEPNSLEIPRGKHRAGWFYFAPPADVRVATLVYQPSSTAGDDYAAWTLEH
jgi:hypothetical protein